MEYITLSKEMLAIVDSNIAKHINEYKWYVSTDGKKQRYYAVTGLGSKNTKVRMHRFIWELVNGPIPKKMDIDHVSRDTLDNRLSNLRLATRSQNNINSKVRSDNTSGFKGVFYVKGRKSPYWAYIWANKKRIGLGMYKTAEEANQAYQQAAKKHYKDFA